MICVATNARTSFDSIDRWRNEINKVESDKPTMLILTKSDLQEVVDDPVSIEELRDEAG